MACLKQNIRANVKIDTIKLANLTKLKVFRRES